MSFGTKGENIDKNIVFLNLARVWFTRGGLLIGKCHPGTMVAASVPPNGFIFEGALGKAPSISPERQGAFWFTRGGLVVECGIPAAKGRASCPPTVMLQGGGHGVHPLDPQCWRTFRFSRHEDGHLNLPERFAV